ncbi:hypothetical protein GTQ99_00605 [Kineococcus sp. T13]|uniref:helix-turn-helix domain-containing protein n=1 Tax=Kineococcus vitellinus TaxID=2696565 RepID=UPI00141202A7|nr:helix-turn-helix transcriptional regulator [Kineococcus vitellinus]NAZ73932.1 hypothetical protein [Kineococcus vitellinus]
MGNTLAVPNEIAAEIGARIATAAEAKKLTWNYIGVRLNTSGQQVKGWSEGRGMKAHNVVPLAEILGVSPVWLLTGKGRKPE